MTNELVNEKITSTCTAIFHLNLKAKKIWFILKNDLIDKQESIFKTQKNDSLNNQMILLNHNRLWRSQI